MRISPSTFAQKLSECAIKVTYQLPLKIKSNHRKCYESNWQEPQLKNRTKLHYACSKAPSTRIRFHLKTQLFLYGYGFRPHVSDENGHQKRNFWKTLSRVELFENAVYPYTCGQIKTKLFENADVTLPVPVHSAQHCTQNPDGEQSLSFLISNSGAYFKLNCMFPNKFSSSS